MDVLRTIGVVLLYIIKGLLTLLLWSFKVVLFLAEIFLMLFAVVFKLVLAIISATSSM